jgi:uncharacterized SAM-binding protein YcdF (DUF218 family)
MIKLFKKSGLIIIILLFIILIISLLISNHYFDWFVENFDKICEFYIKNK